MKNRRAGRKQQRKENTRTLKFERMLIVSEGTKTEVAYFMSIKESIQERYKDNLIVEKIDIFPEGIGRGTMEVVQSALKSRNRHTYSDVWVVIDKDEFPDFDEAILRAEKEGLSVAWSNQSFELWYLLHFQNVSTAMINTTLVERLSTHQQRLRKSNDKYLKSSPLLYEDIKGDMPKAIDRSEQLLNSHRDDGVISPSKMNPATTVHHLLAKLTPYLI